MTAKARDKKIRTDSEGRVLLKSMSYDELESWVVDTLGDKKFRAKQLWTWMYIHLAESFAEMTNLSHALRQRLEEEARLSTIELNSEHQSSDGTRKITWTLDNESVVESVLIPADGRQTLCISSQVGCAMNCQFCYTAKMGLHSNLSTAEIVDQVVMTRRLFAPDKELTNVVFMGMGEPFHNPDNVIPASNILIDRSGLDLSYKKVTVSTSGLVPEILRYGEESKGALAVSLNATTDAVRDWIMPINRKYPLRVLIDALEQYPVGQHDRMTLEYVMLKDVNDSLDDAHRLVKLTSNLRCKINLIPFNPHEGTEFQRSSAGQIQRFRKVLERKRISVTVRQTRGDDEMAACGQLGEPGDKTPKRMSPPPEFISAIQS